jgi:hypothetical protein
MNIYKTTQLIKYKLTSSILFLSCSVKIDGGSPPRRQRRCIADAKRYKKRRAARTISAG